MRGEAAALQVVADGRARLTGCVCARVTVTRGASQREPAGASSECNRVIVIDEHTNLSVHSPIRTHCVST